MIDVKGKWTLITGASRGIGRLSALMMAQQGSDLLLHSRSAAHCEEVLREVQKYGVKTHVLEAELSDPAQVEKLCREIDELGIVPDIILNNAGLLLAYRKDYLNTPPSDYAISFQVNVTAPMQICYHFLPKMQEKGFGRIVNTTSGIDLEPEQAGYSAAKAALNKVTRDLGKYYEGTDVILS
ncbi:MAG: SDR family oxidoreductase, partial [Erysipelotrichaceae bacterium]|nr:SDR family oxidoreductase [Erysipelotrichaceae bacterium]